MTKKELIDAIQDHDTHMSKATVEKVMDFMASVIQQQLADGGEVTLPRLGKFSVKHRAEREGRNPQTGEAITIAAKQVVNFKAHKALNDKLN